MFDRYVALGDSQTEGMNDPDGNGGFIGWADRLAGMIARVSPQVRYANLAVRGKVTEQIQQDQLAPAKALDPDLVTLVGGINDLVKSRPLPSAVERLDVMFEELTATGATVVTSTFPDFISEMPFGSRIAGGLADLNNGVRTAAEKHGVTVVELADSPDASDPRWYSRDRLHLNPAGHAWLAAAFAEVLGLPDEVIVRPDEPPSLPRVRLVEDARWVVKDLVPAAIRRVRGRSSGDGRSPKRPALEPVLET